MTTTTPGIAHTQLKIGLEVHVELATRSKMFTRAANVAHPDHYDAEPNSLIDPMVAALPGTLPVMNRAAVEMSMMVGLALDCTISRFTKWDRKNYFYPDLPKGYQLSQYDLPLCLDGALEIPGANGTPVRIGIIRAHLEEDTGKLGHELPGGGHYEGSLVDLNRAGAPLLEIVTHPDFTCADDVVTFGRELRNICRALRVSEGIMQRGHMRFEPNVNLVFTMDDGREIATPVVEVKNLNSFKAVKGAIEHEAMRQVEAWTKDGLEMGPGMKSTRGWDDVNGVTLLQREKEDAHDYRYFPEPDLPPVVVDDAWLAEVEARLPELPMARRARYARDYGLSEIDALTLADDPDLAAFFDACTALADGAASAKLLLNAGAKRANERDVAIHALGITPAQVAGVTALRADDQIGSTAADTLFGALCETDDEATIVAERDGLLQVKDEGALDAWVEEAIGAHEQAAADFAAGKDAAAGRLVGEVMKRSQGKADAKAVRERLEARLRG